MVSQNLAEKNRYFFKCKLFLSPIKVQLCGAVKIKDYWLKGGIRHC